MSRHAASITWARGSARFSDHRYSRRHVWRFDGGVEVPASSSPHSVRLPYSSEDAVDPEEAFVASIASCHMLWFLSIAAKRGHVVDRYADEAEGFLEKNADGAMAMTRVILHPKIDFDGTAPPPAAEIAAIHEAAHEACFIANSVKTDIRIAA
ncbi:MAG: OsmC family protein [Proteobacteria bacterium]|nr:OsmC family protein [Pseudomonadota bacterium]